MKHINKEFLKSLDPCTDRWKNYLTHYSEWSGTTLEFMDLEHISDKDRLWVGLRPEIIPEKKLHLLGCQYAEDVLHIFEKEYPDDESPRLAIEAKRKWVNGEISDDELVSARASASAWASESALTWALTWASESAWASAWASESAIKKQADQMIEVIKETEPINE